MMNDSNCSAMCCKVIPRPSRHTGLWARVKHNVTGYYGRKLRKQPDLKQQICHDTLVEHCNNPGFCPRDGHIQVTLNSTTLVEDYAGQANDRSYGELLKELPFYEAGLRYNSTKLRKKEVHDLGTNKGLSFGVQTETHCCETQCDMKSDDRVDDLFQYFERKSINKVVKKAKLIKTYSKLTNFLRTKFFMRSRDHSLINTMVNDARIWMIKSGFNCESDEDFFVMTQSVIVAFMVNEQEMKFRQHLKNEKNYDNMVHLNKTVAGDLGKVSLLRKRPEGALSAFLPSLMIPKATGLAL